MERNSAVCAMEWSIELEKALRSKKPSLYVEVILQTGRRLEQWSREPETTMAAYNLFGLVPGADRLFANTILLRLADAFKLGDKHTKLAVVRIFLSEYRNRDKKKNKGNKGILSKDRLHNQLELLTRVKVVFDTGDLESRALALALFGCWADFAKDSAQIRYLILSSLVSSHVFEVKASLFAAGCFSELSDDFACVVLEMLVNMVTSSETVPAVRLAGARLFAKIGCSNSIAIKAYKTGLKLVLDSSEEDFSVSLLVSLSKLASKLTILTSEQVDLLFSFLRQEKSLRVKATVLRCLHFIFMKGPAHFPPSADIIKALLSTLTEPELPTFMQYDALRILHKILSYSLPHLPCLEILEIDKLLAIGENSAQSHIISRSFLFARILADIIKLRGKTEMESGVLCSSTVPSRVVSLIIDQITLLVVPLSDLCQTYSQVFQKVNIRLNLLVLLVGEHPDLGVLVLDKISLLIESVANKHDHVMATKQSDVQVDKMEDFKREKSTGIRSKLMLIVYRFVVACLENLNEASALTPVVFERVKLLVDRVCQCSLFDCFTHTIYSLLLHHRRIWSCLLNESEENCHLNRNSLNSFFIEREIPTLECANKILKERHNWRAYRSGIYAACQGAWFTASFIFGELVTKVQSDICHCWLNSINELAHSERKIQLLLLPNQGSTLAEWLERNKFPASNVLDEITKDAAGNTNEPNYIEELAGAYEGICSAGKTLEAANASVQGFCFARWFLHLRARFIRALVDILRILRTIPFNMDNTGNNGEVGSSISVQSLKSLPEIGQMSLHFRKLAREFDLLAASFIDMDDKSAKVISSLALSCSLLAFSTGFIFFIPNLASYDTFTTCGLENIEHCLHTMLVQNLIGRLWLIDHEINRNLCKLFDISGQGKKCFHLRSRNKILKVGCEEKDILSICGYAVAGAVHLQQASKEDSEDISSQVTKDGLQHLSSIIMKLIHITFRTPKYFFQVRNCIGSKIFSCSSNTKKRDGISALPGFSLSLDLCLQLINMPPNFLARLTKLYCILYSRVSFQEPKPSEREKQQGCRAWETDDLVEINEMLFQYVTNLSARKINTSKRRRSENNEDTFVYSFVHFEPNERGQGFASCLLDISSFPVGSYRIKWHSCCIDNEGSYWSLLPLNAGPVVSVRRSGDTCK